jgi:hypothetical protein
MWGVEAYLHPFLTKELEKGWIICFTSTEWYRTQLNLKPLLHFRSQKFTLGGFARQLRKMPKNMAETEKPQMTSQHGTYALHAGLARLHALTRMHTPMRPGTHMHARMNTQANKSYFLLFHGNNDSQKGLSVTLHCSSCSLPLLPNTVASFETRRIGVQQRGGYFEQ